MPPKRQARKSRPQSFNNLWLLIVALLVAGLGGGLAYYSARPKVDRPKGAARPEAVRPAVAQSEPELPAVESPPPPRPAVLAWTNPQPEAPLAEALDLGESRYLSCGPYQVEMRFRLDQDKLKNPPAEGWPLLSLGSTGELRLQGDGRLTLRRQGELRVAGDRREIHVSQRSLRDLPTGELDLVLAWTGRRCQALVGGELWLDFPSAGTRVWGDLRSGPWPGRVLSLKLSAGAAGERP